jgi:hypothetical protein
MDDPKLPPRKTPQEVADQAARNFFGVTDDVSRRRAIRQYLIGVVWYTVLIPAMFYLRFRNIGPLGWGTTIFFDTDRVMDALVCTRDDRFLLTGKVI